MKYGIETDRTIIRVIRKEDAKELLPYLQEDKIKQIISLPKTLERLEDYIMETAQKNIRWVILKKETNTIIGSIVLRNISKNHQRGDLGYRISINYEGKGYMSEALSAVIPYIFQTQKIQRIQARVEVNNTPSAKLLEKIGFKYEGKARNFLNKNGHYYDYSLYGLLKEEQKEIEL